MSEAVPNLQIPGITDTVEIGSGGFGVVYRAEEADLGRTVAVKILTGNLDEAGRIRFDRERRAMGTLSGHPNIVTIYRGGYTPRGNAYLVMEYLARGSLAGRLKASGPLPWPEVLTIGVQLAGALETSHRAGVLHRDIKPGNILLSNLGQAKLCDFGIARLQGAPETRSAVVTASLAHAPPDVLSGQRPDARSDVYSLASTLYELATGRAPFVQPTDESMMPLLARIHRDPVPPADEQILPRPLFEAIERAMAKEPPDRPATAAAFGQLLVDAQRQLGQNPTVIPIEDIPLGPDGLPVGASGPSTLPPSIIPPSTIPPTTFPPSTIPPTTFPPAPPEPTTADPTTVAPPGLATSTPPPYPPPITTGPSPDEAPPAGYAPGRDPGGSPFDPRTTSTANSGRPRPAWLLPAAAAAAAVILVGGAVLVWSLTRGDDTATGPDTTDATATSASQTTDVSGTTATTTGQTAATGTDDANVPTEVTVAPADVYGNYRYVSDTTGSIRLQVPDEWNANLRGPGQNGLPYLAAAPVLDNAFFDSFEGAGVSVELVADVVEPEQLLDDRRDASTENRCDGPARDEFLRPYEGRMEAFNNCGGTDTVLVHAALVDRAAGLTVYVVLQGPTAKDVNAFGKIIQSIELTANY